MTILQSLILGIVEGFTEFLPISSTAHLILASHVLGLDQSAFVKTFEISVQSGAILAVLAVYWRKFLDIEVLKRVLAAFLPTAIIGLTLYSFIKKHLVGNISVVLWALAIGGILIIVFEYFFKKRADALANIENPEAKKEITDIRSLTYPRAALIGIAQAVAIIPGVSRSAASIIGGLFTGMSRAAIVEFSFLLAVPTIGAATVLDLIKNAGAFTTDEAGSLAVGLIAAFLTALAGIKFLLSYIRNRSFTSFGIYRIALVFVFILLTHFF